MEYNLMLFKQLPVFLIACFLPALAYAQQRSGIGGMAISMLDPVSVISDFVHSACLVIGGVFLFASIIKYKEHRRSPLMVPISTVVFLLISGLVLISLPLISFVVSNGIPYSLLK